MVVSLNSRLESDEEEEESRHSLGRERRPTQDSQVESEREFFLCVCMKECVRERESARESEREREGGGPPCHAE